MNGTVLLSLPTSGGPRHTRNVAESSALPTNPQPRSGGSDAACAVLLQITWKKYHFFVRAYQRTVGRVGNTLDAEVCGVM